MATLKMVKKYCHSEKRAVRACIKWKNNWKRYLQYTSVLPGTDDLCERRAQVSRQVLHSSCLSDITSHACIHRTHLYLKFAHQHSRQKHNVCMSVSGGCPCLLLFLRVYLYVVDSKRQKVSQQVRPWAVVYTAMETVINVDVVTSNCSIGL